MDVLAKPTLLTNRHQLTSMKIEQKTFSQVSDRLDGLLDGK
jgi:hypothetical protein